MAVDNCVTVVTKFAVIVLIAVWVLVVGAYWVIVHVVTEFAVAVDS